MNNKHVIDYLEFLLSTGAEFTKKDIRDSDVRERLENYDLSNIPDDIIELCARINDSYIQMTAQLQRNRDNYWKDFRKGFFRGFLFNLFDKGISDLKDEKPIIDKVFLTRKLQKKYSEQLYELLKISKNKYIESDEFYRIIENKMSRKNYYLLKFGWDAIEQQSLDK